MIRITFLLLGVFTTNLCAQSNQEEFFGLGKIWDVHIELSRAQWVEMFPSRSQSPTRLFGEFPYQTGDVTIGSHALKNVGIRMKGNATFIANAGTLKKSFKVDFNRNDPEQEFLGLGKLNFQSNALDRTQIKEAVSYHIYRSCGLAAGRTCFARVYLTLGDDLKRSYLGLYTVVEQVDQRFAKRTLGSGGLIVKPQGETLEYLGPDWNEDYENSYFPKSKAPDELTRPLIQTAALFDEPNDEAFANRIDKVMDVESFLKYTAATTILINTDSPLTVPDNYYLIVPESTRKVTWIPWDMNWSMGEYGHITGTPTVDLSILKPTEKEVFRRVLEIPKFKKRYLEIVAEFIDGPCSAEAMTSAMNRAHETVEQALSEESARSKVVIDAPEEIGGVRRRIRALEGRDGDNFEGLLSFAQARHQSVKSQLAGELEGRSARNLFGPNDRTVRGSYFRDIIASTEVLDDSQQQFNSGDLVDSLDGIFDAIDADDSAVLENDEFTAILRQLWKAKRRRPREVDPSEKLSRRAVADLDADGDDRIKKSEWKAGIAAMLRYWDRDEDGSWSREELGLPSGDRLDQG